MNPEKSPAWIEGARAFLRARYDTDSGGYASVIGGDPTLYGTGYAALCADYLRASPRPGHRTREFVLSCQDSGSGLFTGPELRCWAPSADAVHDMEHLVLHSTCATLPVLAQFGWSARHPLRAGAKFCDREFLAGWLARRDFKRAWFEGNNLLFVGQLLAWLRDVEGSAAAAVALSNWFDWLDRGVDAETSLWGTDGCCSVAEALYGGYHQLLLYFYEKRPVRNPSGLADAVLSLQHCDGSFSPAGDGGACEDVDAVDVLVNLYKRSEYKRAEIRAALRRCAAHIRALQNGDGGFPYNRSAEQSHMGIPSTTAAPGVSTTFATWFRVHTLALIGQVVTDDPTLDHEFNFNVSPSMGWHRPWKREEHAICVRDRFAELASGVRRQARFAARLPRRVLGRARRGGPWRR